VVVSSDVVGPKMAGPAIRAVELARVLERALEGRREVVLAAPDKAALEGGPRVVSFRRGGLARLARSAEVILGQGLGVPLLPLLAPGHSLVLDFYDPNPVELMAFHRQSDRRTARRSQEHLRHRLLALARRGDHFLCATMRQRDFWLGLLASAGRLSWEADRSHPNLDDLISVVPFGLPEEEPRAGEPVLKGVWPGIGARDKVLLWGGGIWNWFDPLTVIRAVGLAAQRRPELRLFFLGTAHPNPRIPAMMMTRAAWDLAREMGLLDKHVFFNQGWVDYDQRAGFLLEADLAVLASGRDLETRLSFRTRLLDSLWSATPMVLTEGDHFAGLVAERGLGRVVPVGDAEGMARAILELLDDPEEMEGCRRRLKTLALEMTWERTARPLAAFCRAPRFHPGAVHSSLGRLGLAGQYYLGLARVLARYGGAYQQLRRRFPRIFHEERQK